MQEQYKAKGNEAFKAKNHTDAIEWYTKAIDVDPDIEAAGALYSNRAASYTALGKYEEAVKDGDNCIRVRPNWLKGHFRKGVALESLGRLDEALKAFDGSLQTEPNNEEIQEKINTLRIEINDRNAKAKPSSCKTPDQAKVLGNSLFATGKYDVAAEFYGRAIELSTNDASIPDSEKAAFYSNRAACRQQIHDYSGVVDDANNALAIVPNHVKALLRRAIAREGLEKWKLALEDYTLINQISPGMSNVSQGVTRCQRAIRNM